ncbi:hypothetical protein BVX95_00410, partial [archaeon D22]
HGPVIGTVHGAKGREADNVRFYLPPMPWGECEDAQYDEEARIVFVAATRARKNLKLGKGASRTLACRLDTSGRAYTPRIYNGNGKRAAASVEIGRIGDIDAAGLVGKRYFSTQVSAMLAQEKMSSYGDSIIETEAFIGEKSQGYRYGVRFEKGANSNLCYLSESLNYDLFNIAKHVDAKVKKRMLNCPSKIPYLRIVGTRTLALKPGDPIRETLYSPWCDSGFILAPLLVGYGMLYFRHRR